MNINSRNHDYQTMVDEQEETAEAEKPEEDNFRYGIGKWTPSWLQCLNTPRWLVFWMSTTVFTQSLCVNGLVGVAVSTLEKRFGLQSKQAGLIPSVYEFAGIPLLLFIGIIGHKVHRPRWVSAGTFIMGLGCLLFAIPHFSTGIYRSSSSGILNQTCHLDNNISSYDECSATEKISELSKYLYVFVVAMVMFAIGTVPLMVLGVTFMDDSMTREKSSFYLGIFFSCDVLGAAVAYIGGGLLLDVYTDVGAIDLSTLKVSSGDPGWVGAWWIGFLFSAGFSLLPAIFLLGYPYDMPGAKAIRESKIEESHDNGAVELVTQPGFGSSIKDLPSACKVLATNPTFVFTVIAGTVDSLVVTGFSNFGPKYIENEFGVSASVAGLIFGAIAVPGGAGGQLVGSYLIKRFSLNCKQLLKYIPIATGLTLLSSLMFIIQCDNVDLVGVNTTSNGVMLNNSLQLPCNVDCQCSESHFDAVCGDNGLSFFSACHAGCLYEENVDDKIYTNCSCVANMSITTPDGVSVMSSNATARPGLCDVGSCKLMPLFIILFFLAMFGTMVSSIFHISVLLRCVPAAQRSLALGFDWTIVRAFGNIPGPLIFGAVLDKSCLLWEQKCTEIGNCLHHDNHYMAWYMLIICAACKLLATICAVIAWKVYKPFSDRTRESFSSERQLERV